MQKGLWPVPATLGVVALAALLAFVLLATYGAQPVAAQDGGACTSVDHLGDADPDTFGDQAVFECQVTSSDAVITLTNGTDDEHRFYVFAEAIGSGAAEVYPPGTMFANGAFRSGNADTDPVVAPIRYQIVNVPGESHQGRFRHRDYPRQRPGYHVGLRVCRRWVPDDHRNRK